MAQKYKVYFANCPVFFISEADKKITSAEGVMHLQSQGEADIQRIRLAVEAGAREIVISTDHLAKTWKHFQTQFEFVQAAGGLVKNLSNEFLFIYRMDKWDLPKGKTEINETLEIAAMREVEEECGIGQLEVRHRLCTTWHCYEQHGRQMLKATEWYEMKHSGSEIPTPQLEEKITKAIWLAQDQLEEIYKNTYPSVKEVMDNYFSLLSESKIVL